MQEFKVDFVKRSIDILENYKGPHTFSNLINCTLGLIILPYENIKDENIWEKHIDEITAIDKESLIIFEPLMWGAKNKKRILPKTLKTFLTKVRHGLAHQNIVPINKDGTLYQIEITNH